MFAGPKRTVPDEALAAFQKAKRKREEQLQANSSFKDANNGVTKDGICLTEEDGKDVAVAFPLCLTDEELQKVDLYNILRLKQDSSISPRESHKKVKPDRIRHAFHRLSQKYHPRYGTAMHLSIEETTRAFEEVCFAFNALRDKSRKYIYDELGLIALRTHENYMENSIFDEASLDVYEHFFNGVEEGDKLYLLLNGPNCLTDSEEDEPDMTNENGEAPDKEHKNNNKGGDGKKIFEIGKDQDMQIGGDAKSYEAAGFERHADDISNEQHIKCLSGSISQAENSAENEFQIVENHEDEIIVPPPQPGQLKSKIEAEKQLKAMEDALLDKMLGKNKGTLLGVGAPQLRNSDNHCSNQDVWQQLQTTLSSKEKSTK